MFVPFVNDFAGKSSPKHPSDQATSWRARPNARTVTPDALLVSTGSSEHPVSSIDATGPRLVAGSAETVSSGPQSESEVVVEEEIVDEEIISLCDALIGLSTKDTGTIPKAKYYSVVVGRCCGVYSSW